MKEQEFSASIDCLQDVISFIEQELADSLEKASKIAFFEVSEGSVKRIENG